MNFFGIEVAMIGYQGTVFPVLLAVWFMSMVEKRLRRVIPDALDLILTPFLTVIISGFIALLLIGPAGRALGDGISFILSTLISHAGWLAGLLFGGLLFGDRHYRYPSQLPCHRSRTAGQPIDWRQLPAADLGDGQRRPGRRLLCGVV